VRVVEEPATHSSESYRAKLPNHCVLIVWITVSPVRLCLSLKETDCFCVVWDETVLSNI
jgi:hypothetical protein